MRFFWPHTLRPRLPCVSRTQLRLFLQQGIGIIEEAGFASTIGHRYLSDLQSLPTGSIRQFHFYGRRFGDPGLLPRALPDTIVGEFSVIDGRQGGAWRWLPEPRGQAARVRDRLLELERLGYPMALLWPDDLPFSLIPPHDPKLSAETADGIQRFFRASIS